MFPKDPDFTIDLSSNSTLGAAHVPMKAQKLMSAKKEFTSYGSIENLNSPSKKLPEKMAGVVKRKSGMPNTCIDGH